jgi:hypothetical protein
MTPTYFEWLERKDLRSTALDVIEWPRSDAPGVDGIDVEHERISDEQWAALVKRLAGNK